MFVVKSKHSDEYLKKNRFFGTMVRDIKQATIYRSELGAKRSITSGLLRENAHLLENYEIIPVILNIK